MAKHLHFIGIAGYTMSGLALAAREAGYEVTGTDPNAYPPSTDFLDAKRIRWWRSPAASHVQGASAVIISGGTAPDDIEIKAAQAAGIPVRSFAEFWGGLTQGAYSMVVSGTHGKTTTTGLLAWLLESAGKQPDFLIGATTGNFDSSVRYMESEVVVSEGDEYQSSQLDAASKLSFYHPNALIVTSVEMDHPDMFPDLAAVEARFEEAVKQLKPDSKLYLCADDAGAAKLAGGANCQVITYGQDQGDWRSGQVSFGPGGLTLQVKNTDKEFGSLTVPLYGRHNVLNSLAAVAVAFEYGVSCNEIALAAKDYKGATRRFHIVTPKAANIRVVDDYAHHPTAAKATIEAAKLHFGGRVLAVYQPHTFSRTQTLLPEYQQAFTGADQTFLAPIEGARERHLETKVSSADIAREAPGQIQAIDDRDELIKSVLTAAGPDDTILVMSVSGYNGLAEELAKLLPEKFK